MVLLFVQRLTLGEDIQGEQVSVDELYLHSQEVSLLLLPVVPEVDWARAGTHAGDNP